MPQKIVVNGVEYDSPDAMPPDVRRQYDHAMETLKGSGKGSKKTVESVPGGVKINVTSRQVQYNIDGKTYDDPAQLPPEIRAKVERALSEAKSGRTEVRVVNVDIAPPRSRGGSLLVWLLVAAIVGIAIDVLL